jgi:hypothetical protein
MHACGVNISTFIQGLNFMNRQLFNQSKNVRIVLFQKKIHRSHRRTFKEPLTYVWWRRAIPEK